MPTVSHYPHINRPIQNRLARSPVASISHRDTCLVLLQDAHDLFLDLMVDAGPVIRRCVAGAHDVYARLGWRFPASIDRVYDPGRAEAELGFRATWDFRTALQAGDG
jgi:hypothetical protein